MASTVLLGCGHGLRLLDATTEPPDRGPWALWPDADIEPGDRMSCIVCGFAQNVIEVRGELIPLDDNGKLVFQ